MSDATIMPRVFDLAALIGQLPELPKQREYIVPAGMPLSVFNSKYSRKKPDGTMQTYAERIRAVVDGNFSLDPRWATTETDWRNPTGLAAEYLLTQRLAVAGVIPTSGRHLQHGDRDQANRALELHANCSTAMFSFMLFRLLLRGSGVGRDYSGMFCRVNWDYTPNIRLVLDEAHADYNYSEFGGYMESLADARHKYDSESEDVRWFEVADSREGWSKCIEILETAAFQKKHAEKLFIFDFSQVRAAGAPIMGLQGRPASGPLGLMRAMAKIATIKGVGMKPWKQAQYIDHYLAACVQLGGARRSARMSVKHWKDTDCIEFIDIKRGGFMWSTNNSILVDQEFWTQARNPKPSHGRRIFEAAVAAAYYDSTGEPGFINVDMMNHNRDGMDEITADNYINPQVYTDLHPRTRDMVENLLPYVKKVQYPFLTNPCVTADAWIMTDQGPRMVVDLIGKKFKALVNGKAYKATGFFQTGVKKIRQIITDRGYELAVTHNHKILIETSRTNLPRWNKSEQKIQRELAITHEWREAKDIRPGDKIVLQNHGNYTWPGEGGTFEEGWLIGNMLGNGCHNPAKYQSLCRFWGDTKETMAEYALNAMFSLPNYRDQTNRNFVGQENPNTDTITVTGTALTELATQYIGNDGEKFIEPTIEYSSSNFHQGFLRGIFDADGSVQMDKAKGNRCIRLSQSDPAVLKAVQRMLLRLGIASTIYWERRPAGYQELPDGNGGLKEYFCKAQHELHIAKANIAVFVERVGFTKPDKHSASLELQASYGLRGAHVETFTATVQKIIRKPAEPVYDCTVNKVHRFDANGITAHNCGEIVLSTYGGYCVIGDLCMAQAENDQELIDAAAMLAKFLVRVNLMKADYTAEVNRTNRIGVSLTGIYEYAYKQYGLTFFDLIDFKQELLQPDAIISDDFRWEKFTRVKKFYALIDIMRETAEKAADEISHELNVNVPHTVTTIKPSGTVGKVMACTEGAHLPAMPYYLRWVQYHKNDAELTALQSRGYPVRDVQHKYPDHFIVGFPTKLPIADLMGDDLVTATQASPIQQYTWLQLLEKFWLGNERGNQVSYTLKYNSKEISYPEYMAMVLTQQPQVKVCSVMPADDWQESQQIYGYVPEEPIDAAEYHQMMAQIQQPVATEKYDDQSLACSNGACPIEFDRIIIPSA